MTAVDWIILLVILLYTLNGFHRGFIGTIFNLFGSLAALIAALACASHFRVQVGAKIAPYLKESVSASMPTLSTSVSTSASELWNSISGYLQNILSSQHVSLEVLQAAEELGIPFEHLPTGIDTMCVAIADHDLDKRLNQLLNRISELCQPDSIEVTRGLSLIATVGRGMVSSPGNAAKIFGALYQAGVNVRMIDQGSSELNIIVGVDNKNYEAAVQVLYDSFAG